MFFFRSRLAVWPFSTRLPSQLMHQPSNGMPLRRLSHRPSASFNGVQRHFYSTQNQSRSGYRFDKPIAGHSYFNTLKMLCSVGVFGFMAYLYYQDNVLYHLEDDTLLQDSEENDFIKPMSDFRLTSATRFAGRSGVRKYSYTNARGVEEFYYIKECFSRQRFLNELIYGSYAHFISGGIWPELLLVQANRSDNHTARYYVASKSMSHYGAYTLNLEDWASLFNTDEELAKTLDIPLGLGLSLLIKGLLGDRDIKLANLVNVMDDDYLAYGVDNECCNPYAGRIVDEDALLMEISEYNAFDNKLCHINSVLENGVLDDNPHKKHQGNASLLHSIRPILQASIEDDIQQDRLQQTLERAATMSDEHMHMIIERFDNLMSADEKAQYFAQLQHMRTVSAAHLKDTQEHGQSPSSKLC